MQEACSKSHWLSIVIVKVDGNQDKVEPSPEGLHGVSKIPSSWSRSMAIEEDRQGSLGIELRPGGCLAPGLDDNRCKQTRTRSRRLARNVVEIGDTTIVARSIARHRRVESRRLAWSLIGSIFFIVKVDDNHSRQTM